MDRLSLIVPAPDLLLLASHLSGSSTSMAPGDAILPFVEPWKG
jgi:hypothetical protein